jgi:hypothetical protein
MICLLVGACEWRFSVSLVVLLDAFVRRLLAKQAHACSNARSCTLFVTKAGIHLWLADDSTFFSWFVIGVHLFTHAFWHTDRRPGHGTLICVHECRR